MKYQNIYLLIAVLCLLSSCQKEGVTEYDSSMHYIYIPSVEKNIKDINLKTFSFKHHVGVDDYEIQFPVKLAGYKLDEDKIFRVEVVNDEEATTASSENYTLPREQIFHAGVFEDVVKVILHRTAILAEKEVKITFRLVPNENFKLADYMGDVYYNYAAKSITATVTFSDKISKPEWWNTRITNLFLGEYSDKKYQYFIESTNVSDLTGLGYTEIRELALKFKKDLELHDDWLDENDNPITVPVN